MAEQESLRRANAAEQTAESEAVTATETSKFLVNLFMTADPVGTGKLGFRRGDEVGTDLTLKELLARGSRQAQSALKDQPVARARLLDTLGKVYSNLGQIDESEPLLREAYELRLERLENETDLATSLLNMGWLLRWKGEYAEAERLLRQTLEIRTRVTGPNSLAVAEVEFALGWTLIESERFGVHRDPQREVEFDKLMHHALETQRRELGSTHRDVGLTLTVLMMRLLQTGKQAEAQRMLLSSAAVFVQQEGGKSLGRAVFEYQRAANARQQSKFAEAENSYRACLDTIGTVLGTYHPINLAILGDLAGMFRDQGRMVESEAAARQALDVGFHAFPNGHPVLRELLEAGASFLATQGKYDEAVALVEKKMLINERFFDLPWTQRAADRLTIAGFRLEQGRFDETRQVLDAIRLKADELHLEPNEASGLVLWLRWATGHYAGECGNLTESERVGRECVELNSLSVETREEMEVGLANVIQSQRPSDPEIERLLHPPALGWTSPILPKFPHLVMRHLALANYLIENARLDEAEPILRFAHEFVHSKTLPGNYYIGLADSLMGALLATKQQDSEAEPLLIAGFENLRKSRGDHHRLTRKARDRLVKFYRQTGRDEQADKYVGLLGTAVP